MLKTGISTKVLDDFNLQQSIELASQIGYETLELWTSDIQSSGLTTSQIRDLLRAKKLDYTVHIGYEDLNLSSFNPTVRQESIKQTLEGIRIAGELGAKVATVHPGKQSSEPGTLEQSWQLQIEAYQELVAEAEKYNLKLGVENMEKTTEYLVIEPKDIYRLISAINSPNLGLTLDLAHCYTLGEVDIFLQGLYVPIVNVHISQGSNMKMHVPLYDSWAEIDYTRALNVLSELYAGPLILEGYIQGLSEHIARESHYHLAKLIENVKGETKLTLAGMRE